MADELVICEGWQPSLSTTSDAAMLWEALFFASKSPVSIIDINGQFLAANDLLEQSFHVPPGGLVGRNMSEFMTPEMLADRLEVIRRVSATGQPENMVGRTWGVEMQCAIRPLTTPPGGVPRVLHVIGFAGRPSNGVTITPLKHHDMGVLEKLTLREREVLALIGEGLPTAEIAARLHRSVKTIEWHRASLGTKLNASNRVELAQIALRLGLVKNWAESHPFEEERPEGSVEGSVST